MACLEQWAGCTTRHPTCQQVLNQQLAASHREMEGLQADDQGTSKAKPAFQPVVTSSSSTCARGHAAPWTQITQNGIEQVV